MMKKLIIPTILSLLLLACQTKTKTTETLPARPNIIYILADD